MLIFSLGRNDGGGGGAMRVQLAMLVLPEMQFLRGVHARRKQIRVRVAIKMRNMA